MDNKIIDINEWVRWVIKKHPSQKQITTIKKYWSCNTIKDYCIDNKLLPFNKSNIRIWSKADNFEISNGDDYLEEEKKIMSLSFSYEKY